MKINGIVMGPFSEAELASNGINREPEKKNTRGFAHVVVSTMNGVPEEHIEIGTDIWWGITELQR